MKFNNLLIISILSLVALLSFGRYFAGNSYFFAPNQQCDSTFTFSQTNDTCENRALFQFMANADSSCADSLIWDFGDGTGNAGRNFEPRRRYAHVNQDTTYRVCLTVVDTANNSRCQFCDSIRIKGWQLFSVNISRDSIFTWRNCFETRPAQDTLLKTLWIDTTGNAPAGPIKWVFESKSTRDVLLSSGRSIQYPFVYGTWQISAFLPNDSCPGYTRTFYYYTEPIPSLGNCQNTVCEQDSVCFNNLSLTLPGHNVDQYRWFFDYGKIVTYYATSPDSLPNTVWHVYDLSNRDICKPVTPDGFNVDVRLVGINHCFQSGRAYSQSGITVKVLPRAEFGWDKGDTLIRCISDSVVVFENLSCPDSNYRDSTRFEWFFDDPSSGLSNYDTTKHPFHIFRGGIGTYTIRLIASNSCGEDTFERVLKLVDEPFADAEPDTAYICTGDSVLYQNLSKPDSFLAFTWSSTPAAPFIQGTDSSSENPYFQFPNKGVHHITLKAENTCPDPDYWHGVVYVDTVTVIDWTPVRDSCGPVCFDPIADFADEEPYDSIVWHFHGGQPTSYIGKSPPAVCFSHYFDEGDTNFITITAFGLCDTVVVRDTFLLKKLPDVVIRDTLLCPGASAFHLDSLSSPAGGNWLCIGCNLQPINGVFQPVLGTPPC